MIEDIDERLVGAREALGPAAAMYAVWASLQPDEGEWLIEPPPPMDWHSWICFLAGTGAHCHGPSVASELTRFHEELADTEACLGPIQRAMKPWFEPLRAQWEWVGLADDIDPRAPEMDAVKEPTNAALARFEDELRMAYLLIGRRRGQLRRAAGR